MADDPCVTAASHEYAYDHRCVRIVNGEVCYRAEDDPVHQPATAADRAEVVLFKQSGKYYTEEQWRIPIGAIGPHDMERSPDFRRIDGGSVLVPAQEPWGYPFLFPGGTYQDGYQDAIRYVQAKFKPLWEAVQTALARSHDLDAFIIDERRREMH